MALRLLLEQILKRCSRIVRTQRCRSRSFFLARHSNLVKLAVVTHIFLRYPHRNRLHALETASRIEIRALLARVQFKLALRTFPVARAPLKNCSTLRAARDRASSGHIDRAWSKCVVPFRRRTSCAGPLARSFSLTLAIAILIPVLTIFRHSVLPKHAACIVDRMPLNRQVRSISRKCVPLQWKHDPRNHPCGPAAVQLLHHRRRSYARSDGHRSRRRH